MAEMQVFDDRKTVLGDQVVYTENNFFRPENINGMRLATEVAPAYLNARGRSGAEFTVVDLGCSRAMDTWSIAVAFKAAGVRARILGVDINPHVLAKAQQPYMVTREYLEERLANWGLPSSCVDLFEVIGDGRIRPGAALRRKVSFERMDIREQTLPITADAAIANNILSYYTGKNRRHLGSMVGNIATGVRVGGYLTIGAFFPAFEPSLGDQGFVPTTQWNDNPSAPNFFERTAVDGAGDALLQMV